MVHIGTFIGQFSTVFGIIAQSFGFCELAFRLSQITGMKGGRPRQSIAISTTAEAGSTLRGRYCREKFKSQTPWRIIYTDQGFLKKAT